MEYDPKKVTVAVGGRAITGFANDSMVNASHADDLIKPYVGVQGDVGIAENADETGEVVISLMSTSASLPYLRQIAKARRYVTLVISDANDDTTLFVNAEGCRVKKLPDYNPGKEIKEVPVTIFVPRLEYR